jgi:hypothetical protein
MNLMSSMRSSTVHVPVPPDELLCHCNPTICVRVGIAEPPVNIANGAMYVVGVAGGAVAIANAGNW